MSFLVSEAMAAADSALPVKGDGTASLIMVVAIFVLFYFMLIRPQNKRAKEHRQLIGQLKKGDEVVTSGGLLAKVVRVDEQYILVTVSEGVDVHLQRSAVSAVLPKGTIHSL